MFAQFRAPITQNIDGMSTCAGNFAGTREAYYMWWASPERINMYSWAIAALT